MNNINPYAIILTMLIILYFGYKALSELCFTLFLHTIDKELNSEKYKNKGD